mgnify:CR=1 FL=1|tara:strand:- start:883 stop:1488 length:606 start_codon:yes stop_codon:yes gene_type:complete
MTKTLLKQEDIEVEQLTESNLKKIDCFTSSVCKELENFLKENAWKESCVDYSKTYLFFHKGLLIGYTTILMDKQSLKINHPNSSLSKFSKKTEEGYSSVPALKIGRICVIDEYNSQLESSNYLGLGKIMLASILDHAKDLKAKIGCRVITTHAKKSTGAHLWYKKMGFCYSNHEEKTKDLFAKENIEAIPMFYDINRIIKT